MPIKTLTKPATPLLLACTAITGCTSTWFADTPDSTSAVQPGDFIGEPSNSPVAESAPQPEPDSPASVDSNAAIASDTTPTKGMLPMDAMVGHINGEAVYADQIFDVNLIAQLESFGRRYAGDEFRQFAGSAIQDRLQGIIINKLILGEAERNLQEAQRRGIEGRIQAEREELLRFYGQGSLAKAKAQFLEKRGQDLEAHLVDFREELIIGSYIRATVTPKIVVNQRDVERYYADNLDKYNQPDQRVIRLIRAVDQAAAEQLQDQLARGKAFDQLAADPELNQYNADNAGLFNSGNAIPGDKVIGLEPVNEALLPLVSGEYAGPIAVGDNAFFVQVVEHTPGAEITLAEAQIQIEQILRSLQFEKHALSFRLDLLERGSYSNPSEMGSKLLAIAAARYDQ